MSNDVSHPDNEETTPVDEQSGDEQPVAEDAQGDAGALAEATAEALDPRTQVRQANDRALRAQAELENFRKRTRRQMDEERRFAAMPLMRELLNVMDNLQRAIEAAEASPSSDTLLAGVKMVADQLQAVLQNHHCLPIEADGAVFDPNLHEAILQHPSTDHPPGTVTQVTQTGYLLHDRVVRPSQVAVSTLPPDIDQPPDAEAHEDDQE